jgi:hypothetical protein
MTAWRCRATEPYSEASDSWLSSGTTRYMAGRGWTYGCLPYLAGPLHTLDAESFLHLALTIYLPCCVSTAFEACLPSKHVDIACFDAS